MSERDQFSRTFLPAAAEAGVGLPAFSRHIPIFRRCVGQRDTPVFVARCRGADPRPARADARRTGAGRRRNQVLLLTRQRLVVTAESGLLRRLRLHLNAELRHLADVTWTPEPALGGIRLAATAVDGVREHFWVEASGPDRVRRLDAVLSQLFAPRPAA
jgi:hypothetical protein